MPTVRGLGSALAGAGLLAILVLTLFPNPRQVEVADHTPLLCLVCGEAGGADVVLNLLLFIPLAAGLALAGWSWGRIVAACALLSLGVETVQYFPLTGRDASLSDVLTNTASGAIGAAVGRRAGRLLAPDPALAQRLSLLVAGTWLGILVLTAVAMYPWAPPGPLRNYCTASFPMSEVFTGTAGAMTLNGVPLACDAAVPHAAKIRRELRQGEVLLETVATVGEPAGGRWLIHLVRTPGTGLVALARHGRAAAFHAPTTALALKLFPPAVRLSHAFPAGHGGPVELVGGREGGRLRLSAASDAGRRGVELPLSPSFGWTLLFPVPIEPGRALRLVAALWLGVLLLPAGYWARRAVRPANTVGVIGGVVIVGLGLIPALTGFDPVHWSEWVGAIGGAAFGWALSRIAAYLQSRCGSPSTSAYSSF